MSQKFLWLLGQLLLGLCRAIWLCVSILTWNIPKFWVKKNFYFFNAFLIPKSILDLSKNQTYIICTDRLKALYKDESEYKVLSKFAGKTLVGRKYKPLFDYFVKSPIVTDGWKVLVDKFVTNESGTGVVHCAPAFGEDDYRVCLNAGIISKGENIVCPVDDSGRFTSEVTDFAGQYIKVSR